MDSSYYQKKRKLEKEGKQIRFEDYFEKVEPPKPQVRKKKVYTESDPDSFIHIIGGFVMLLIFGMIVLMLIIPTSDEPNTYLEDCIEAGGEYVPIERYGKTTIYGCVMEDNPFNK